jgi:molybdopterin converting factor small subunit
MIPSHISIKLFATLSSYTPASPDNYPVDPGITIRHLMKQLGVPEADIKLIFIDGVKGDLTSSLHGGERVGIFPPVGGG